MTSKEKKLHEEKVPEYFTKEQLAQALKEAHGVIGDLKFEIVDLKFQVEDLNGGLWEFRNPL